MERVIEEAVTWRYRGQSKPHTVRYIRAATDEYRARAKSVAASELTDVELDAIEEYRRACQEGKAVIIEGPKRRKME